VFRVELVRLGRTTATLRIGLSDPREAVETVMDRLCEGCGDEVCNIISSLAERAVKRLVGTVEGRRRLVEEAVRALEDAGIVRMVRWESGEAIVTVDLRSLAEEMDVDIRDPEDVEAAIAEIIEEDAEPEGVIIDEMSRVASG